MAIGNTLINSLKIVLMSTGVLFIAILLSLSLPQLLSSATAPDLPSLWSGIQAWLRPPYLYFVINGIIITIAASSRLHHHHAPPAESTSPYSHPKPTHHLHDVISVRADLFSPYNAVSLTTEVVDSAAGSYYGVVSVKDVFGSEKVSGEVQKATPVVDNAVPEAVVLGGGGERERSTVVETPTKPPLARQKAVEMSPEFLSERPPATSRFGHHRRSAKASSAEGGKALRRVAKPKKQDTLESTWKALTEGRHMPLTRHLKKSDTWESQGRQINLLDDSFPLPPVKKADTFKERTNHTPPPVSKLKKEPSLSQDELNRRVEAFINKFNEDMRLQRQQSIQQFMDKINRAAY